MRIAAKRSGGYAGLEEAGQVDTDSLDPASARELEELVRQARLWDRPADGSSSIGADLLHCSLTATDGSRQRTITFVEEGRPDTAALTQLIDAVLRMRKP